jgi:filamentous hemagglutinin family protein
MRGHRGRKFLIFPLCPLIFLCVSVVNPLFFPLNLLGHGENPVVTAGEATFTHPDSHTQEIRAADKTIINFKRFNLAKEERAHFIQPHAKARVLCRVTGGEPSIIEGHLEANGRLFFINPASIVFRETAQVKASSLVASTLDIRDTDFVQGKGRFFLAANAKESAIVNQGSITSDQVILMAPQVVNTGLVTARASFLGGEVITLDFEGDSLISFAIEAPLSSGFMEQGGKIVSEGEVYMGLKVASHLIRSTLNVNGCIEASQIHKENGVIRLIAKSGVIAQEVKIEAPVVINESNFKAHTKVEIDGQQKLEWRGGKFERGQYDVLLKSAQGTVAIDGPITSDPFKSLTLSAKIIDHNSSVNSKAPVVYDAGTIYLGGDLTTFNKDITFTGNVIMDGPVKIVGGYGTGSCVTFMGRVDADIPTRRVEIINNQGTLDFKQSIGSQGMLGELKISHVHNLLMPQVGDKNQAGVGYLNIEESTLNLQHHSLIHANSQTWRGKSVNVSEGVSATFITSVGPLSFSPSCKVDLQPNSEIVFQGKEIELPEISGARPITVRADHGRVTTQKMFAGDLKVHAKEILLGGEITANSIFMEADHDIQYAKTPGGSTFQTAISSEDDVILNAKHGMVGSQEMPIFVVTKGHFYVGAKSVAYLDGTSADGYPHVYPLNPPPRLIFQGNEMQYLLVEEIFAQEEQLLSLTPDLLHTIPGGFIHTFMVTPRRAPIYFTR